MNPGTDIEFMKTEKVQMEDLITIQVLERQKRTIIAYMNKCLFYKDLDNYSSLRGAFTR